jgi:deoxyuridine 5'-triphosphate nucleotidohydrolase
MKNVEVFVELCREDAILPEYAKPGDAGMDVFAAEDIIIKPGQTVIIPTGLKLAIPEGYEIQVRPRSGISLNTPLRIVNSPGTIDSGYRDELGIIVNNSSATIMNNRNDHIASATSKHMDNVARNTMDNVGRNIVKSGSQAYTDDICKGNGIQGKDIQSNDIQDSDNCKDSAEIFTLESKGNKMGTYKIRKGDRIAQIVLQEVPRIKFTLVKSVKNIGEDRGGGFGSTGV